MEKRSLTVQINDEVFIETKVKAVRLRATLSYVVEKLLKLWLSGEVTLPKQNVHDKE